MEFEKRDRILFVIGTILIIIAFYGGLTELVSRWNKQEEYGHGYFIPLISTWFLWSRKDILTRAVGQPYYSGLVLIVLSSIMLVLGEVTALFLLIQVGFILAILGLILLYGGKELFNVSVAPIAFLVFAIPLPYFLEAVLTARLQLLSSDIGVGLLRLLGTSVYLEGNLIDLGKYKLQVVEACSGLRYLYPLMGISFLIAYMYRAEFWKKAFVFFSAAPITVLMNSVRISMVGLLVDNWGSGMADGFLHYFEGWIVFMLCLAILFGEIWLFEHFGQKRQVLSVVDTPVVQLGPVTPKTIKTNYPLIIGVIVILFATIFVKANDDRKELQPHRKSLVTFPLNFGGWKGVENSLSKIELENLGLTDYILADYQSVKGGSSINLYIAYYASQRKGVSPHSPQVCMPGGGWGITSIEPVSISDSNGKNFVANKVIIQKSGTRQLIYYWFDQRGRKISSEYWMKWYLFLDAVQKNRTDGALVRLGTPIAENESVESADRRIRELLDLALPILHDYIPE